MSRVLKSSNRPSVHGHKFSQVPNVEIPRSSFDRSHGHKTAFDAGYLVPILVDEALPGDTFNLSLTGLARMNTPLFPLMDNAYFDTQFFAVPIRLIWDNWEKFNGAQTDPADSTDFTIPAFANTAGISEASLHDYMGIPPNITNLPFSALYARAYNLIYNEWYRDQNLQDSVPVDTGDASGDIADYVLRKRGKRHDYFTSGLPWPQKGDSVDLPLGTVAPVVSAGDGIPTWDGSIAGTDENLTGTGTTITAWSSTMNGDASWNDPKLEADLSTATAATINQLRQAFQVQRLLERDARGGTRYTEIIRSHFGVVSPDQRLQRPEYLGGGSSPIVVNPVASQTDFAGMPVGSLAAAAAAFPEGHGFVKSFTEHCIIIGIASVRADLTYQQGLNRMFSRATRYDFYWPSLAHIGEQAVLNKEIYADGTSTDTDVFAYQERYAEYRYKPSIITGTMRSNSAAPLDAWHLSQDFAALPVLGDTFIQEDPPFDRVVYAPAEPHFIFDGWFSMRCARPMPLYGVPGLIDHF